jgi:hypothetical protein
MYSRTQLIKKSQKGLPFNYLSLFLNIFFICLFLTLLSDFSCFLIIYSYALTCFIKLNVNLTIYIIVERIYIRNKLLNINNHIFSLKRRRMVLLLFITF